MFFVLGEVNRFATPCRLKQTKGTAATTGFIWWCLCSPELTSLALTHHCPHIVLLLMACASGQAIFSPPIPDKLQRSECVILQAAPAALSPRCSIDQRTFRWSRVVTGTFCIFGPLGIQVRPVCWEKPCSKSIDRRGYAAEMRYFYSLREGRNDRPEVSCLTANMLLCPLAIIHPSSLPAWQMYPSQ